MIVYDCLYQTLLMIANMSFYLLVAVVVAGALAFVITFIKAPAIRIFEKWRKSGSNFNKE